MKKNARLTWVAVGVVLAVASGAMAGIQNGEFTTNLSGWTIEAGTVVSSPTLGNPPGCATFQYDAAESSRLVQSFMLPVGAKTLTFDYQFVADGADGGSYTPGDATDTFNASLFDNDTEWNSLVSAGGEDYFFSVNRLSQFDYADGVTVTNMGQWTRVTLDLSGLDAGYFGADPVLAFDYFGFLDSVVTFVNLDNVRADSVVPVPGALALGLIGTALAGWLKRRREV